MQSTEAKKVEETRWFEFYDSFTELFEFFCDNTTIHGTIRLNCSRRNKMKTGFWVILFCFSFGMMYWQFGDTFHKYWSYPTNIGIVLQSKKIIFPAVTVCNLNPYRFRQVNEYLNQLDRLAEETLSTLYGYNASLQLKNDTKIVDLEDIMNNMTFEDDGIFRLDKTMTLTKINIEDGIQNAPRRRQKVGFKLCDSSGKDCYYRSFWSAVDAFHEWYKFHFMNIMSEIPLVLQIPDKLTEKFILTCDFNGGPCDRNCSYFHHPTYGSCITIKGNMTDDKLWSTVKPGTMYGLSLILKTVQNNNIPILSSTAGAKVMIHNANQSPMTEHQAFDIWPGTETSISVREDQVNLLGAPYSECTFDGSNLDIQPLYNSSYTQQSCLQSCFQNIMINRCGCGYYFYSLRPGMEYCDYNKHPGWGHCFYRLYDTLLDHRLVCFQKCPKKCRETRYQLSIGSAKWPASVSKPWITVALSRRIGQNITSKRTDIAKLNVYFQELSLRSFEETPAMNVENLLSTMGNQWSFWFGSSVLSVAEVAELVFDVTAMLLIMGYSKFGKKREENQNLNQYVIQMEGMSERDGKIVTTSQVHERPNFSEDKMDSKPA
ncbi:ligand-gated sodium channel activity [Pristimantis euphronides]